MQPVIRPRLRLRLTRLIQTCVLLLTVVDQTHASATIHTISNRSPVMVTPMLFLMAISNSIGDTGAFSKWKRFYSGRRSQHPCEHERLKSPANCEDFTTLNWNNRSRSSFVPPLKQWHRPNRNKSPSSRSSVVLSLSTKDVDVETDPEKTQQEYSADRLSPITAENANANPAELIHSNSDDNTCTNASQNKNNTSSKTTLYSFHDKNTNTTLHGLSITRAQFKSWVQYKLQNSDAPKSIVDLNECITEKNIKASDIKVRSYLREMWYSRNLICDRTEVLAVYPSDSDEEGGNKKNSNSMPNADALKTKKKRGGFEDLLTVYCDRILGIMEDELNDSEDCSPELESSNADVDVHTNSTFHMKTWLEENYGKRRTQKLLIQNFEKLPLERQKNVFLHLLHWFRENYPYYYDKCGECGASYREDSIGRDEEQDSDIVDEDSKKGTSLTGSFLGYCYPDPHELEGRAARTEMYQCHSCGKYTRFPRYNNVKQIVENGGRGRCGEYSILIYRILRALGHQSRWVVDWADHVWAEVFFDGRWVHMDPCEAALDQPLLYEEWGKKQTYIVAFWMPLALKKIDPKQFAIDVAEHATFIQEDKGPRKVNVGHSSSHTAFFPLVEDVTENYTSDSSDKILSRREDTSTETINAAVQKLVNKFANITS